MIHKTTPHSDRYILFIITPLLILFALTLDFYIPIVPKLTALYQVPHAVMQITLSGFMLAIALSQIITGPLSDHYGRRPIALASLGIFLLGSLISLVPNFQALVLSRLLQAIGASATYLCAYSTIRDYYHTPESSAKMYSLMNVCIAQSPILAPAIGGYIAEKTHWYNIFLLILATGLLTLITTYYFYEESLSQKKTIHPKYLLKSYAITLKHINFLIYSLASATGLGCFFMFLSQSPYILIHTLNHSKTMYGVLFGVVGFAFFIASLATNRLCQRFGAHQTVEIGCLLMLAGGLLLILTPSFLSPNTATFILPMMIAVTGAAFTIGASLSGTMQPFGKLTGIALSAVGFTKFACSAILGFMLMHLPISQVSLGLMITALALLCSILTYRYRERLIKNLDTLITIPF